MCYVHNQWYDISCVTLYFLVMSKGPEKCYSWVETSAFNYALSTRSY